MGTGIAHPPSTPPPHHPGYTPLPHRWLHAARGYTDLRNMVVGLRSVEQLTLSPQISGFRGITEVYNLLITGRINNHFFIPGTD